MADVVVLQHAAEEDLGSIASVLSHRRHRFHYIRAYAGDVVPASLDADGLVIMGGPQSVYEHDRYPWLSDELRLINETLDAQKPVLGICLGSQLLASALGAKVYRGREKEIGWFPVQLHPDMHRDPLFGDIGRTFTAFHWHGDVFDLPHGAAALGHSAVTLNQGFRFGRNAYGLLFHLEATPELVTTMLGAFGGEVKAAGADPDAIASDAARHLPELQQLGAAVFDAWARLLPSDGAAA
jgi:GMP synthase (glutamine-hydrolysing)